MKHNALAALSLALVLGAGLSCDNATGLPKTGGITITLLSPTNGSPIAVRAGEADSDAASQDLIPVDGVLANLTLTGVRITVSGPTNKTVSSQTASGGFFDVTVDGLSPGSYSVTVEGLVGTEVAHFGQTSGVNVTAGSSTPASITFPLFEPSISVLPDTTDVLHFSVGFSTVQNATSYLVQWSKSPSMANAESKTVTSPTADITVADEGNYYIAVKAVNATVPTGGKSSAIQVVYAFQGVATVTVTPATPSIGFGGTQQLAADAKDADNATVPNVSWFWSSDNPSVATVTQGGLVTGVSGGTATITAVGKGMPGSTTVTVGAQLATKLAFSIQPSSSVAGDPLSPAVQVEIQDANGNRVTAARDPVTIAFGANPGSGNLTGTKVVNAINGIASFTGLWVNKAAAGYTLAASSGSLTGATSSTFTVSPAAPAKLAFAQQPTNKEANTALTSVTVTIADLFDNTTSATNQVTIALGANPFKNTLVGATGGTLSGTLTVAAVNGVATFATAKVDKPSPSYTLLASATGLTSANSNAFNINLSITQMAPARYGSHTCAVANGGPYCWGSNGNSQLGILTGSLSADSVPALVRGNLVFTQMVAGLAHSCGITAANDAYCWGYNGLGQLGDNSNTQRPQPVPVNGGHKFSQLSAGEMFTCGLTTTSGVADENRQIWCWGNNADGEMGTGVAGPNALVPVRLPTTSTLITYGAVAAGGFHVCALVHTSSPNFPSKLVCWGWDGEGQVGAGAVSTIRGPTLVTGTQNWASVSTGYRHTCAVATPAAAGNGFCWGSDGNGQLGDDLALANKPAPTVVSASTTWGSIKAGGFHTCGLTAANSTFCWGYNQYGQLGNGTSTQSSGTVQDQPTPQPGGIGITFTALELGLYHSCGLNGTNMFCWGRGSSGQLGSGDRQQVKETPVQIIQ